MKRLVQVADAPADPLWWKNDGHGRRLVCGHESAMVFVPLTQAFCVRCRTVAQVLTADPEAASRLQGAAS